jgi:hypothetical protein
MVIRRAAHVLAPAIVLTLLCAMATSAQASTTISPPTITAPLGGLGPYPVGTPVTFTFSEQGAGTAVAYKYTLNGVTKTVPAPSGAASVQIVPVRQTSFLTAYALAADGTVSAGTEDIFKAFTTQLAADKDLNGDGAPDLLTVGGTPGLAAGLWLATGTAKHPPAAAKGRLNVPATDIGVNGWSSTPGSPSDFNGAQAITGQFTGDGFQDVLIYYPSGNDAGGGAVLAGSGDGSPLQSQISGNEFTISSGALTDANGDNPLQVVNAYASIYGTGLPDLLAISGDPANGYYLDYYEAFAPGGYFNTFAVRTATPDGTADWDTWRLATLSYAAGTGMFLWNESTGALYLWAGLTATDNGNGTGTLAYTQYKISANWNKGVPLSTLEAADFDRDGVPDLWAVTQSGVARAYRISALSTTGTATVKAGKPQNLSAHP